MKVYKFKLVLFLVFTLLFTGIFSLHAQTYKPLTGGIVRLSSLNQFLGAESGITLADDTPVYTNLSDFAIQDKLTRFSRFKILDAPETLYEDETGNYELFYLIRTADSSTEGWVPAGACAYLSATLPDAQIAVRELLSDNADPMYSGHKTSRDSVQIWNDSGFIIPVDPKSGDIQKINSLFIGRSGDQGTYLEIDYMTYIPATEYSERAQVQINQIDSLIRLFNDVMDNWAGPDSRYLFNLEFTEKGYYLLEKIIEDKTELLDPLLLYFSLSDRGYQISEIFPVEVSTSQSSTPVLSSNLESSTVLFSLNAGEKITLLDQNEGKYKMSYNGRPGWISADMINPPETIIFKIDTVFTPMEAITNDSRISVRTAPSLDAGRTGFLDNDEELLVLGRSREKMRIGEMFDYWYQIRTNRSGDGREELEGWSYGYFIDLMKPYEPSSLTSEGIPGTQKWKISLSSSSKGYPVIRNGILYVTSGSMLYALNRDGEIIWMRDFGKTLSAPAIGNDGTIYTLDSDCRLFATGADGEEKWIYNTTDRWISKPVKPVTAEDGTIYISAGTGSEAGSGLYALHPDGSLNWYIQANNGIESLAIGTDGTIYAGSHKANLYVFNPDKSLRWMFPTEDRITNISVGDDDTAYFTTNDKKLYAVSKSGTLRWIFQDLYRATRPLVGPDGTVYAGAHSNGSYSLFAIDPGGSLKWSFQTEGTPAAPVFGFDGSIIFGSMNNQSEDSKVYSLSENGEVLWTFTAGARIITAPAVSDDGVVYIKPLDQNLFAVYGR